MSENGQNLKYLYLAVVASVCSIVAIPLAFFLAGRAPADPSNGFQQDSPIAVEPDDEVQVVPVYLNELSPVEIRVGRTGGFESVNLIDDGEHTAKLKNTIYENAVVSYGKCEGKSSWIEYSLGSEYQSLEGLVGISDASHNDSFVEVEIRLDGVAVWSAAMRKHDSALVVRLPLEGIERLRIETIDHLGPERECGAEGNTITAIDFVNMRLE